jgi:hypothetical protein
MKVAMNPELLTQVAGTTRSQVSQLDWDQISEQVEDVLAKAIQGFDQPKSRLRQLLGKIKS